MNSYVFNSLPFFTDAKQLYKAMGTLSFCAFTAKLNLINAALESNHAFVFNPLQIPA
jgi:hypothetical protein